MRELATSAASTTSGGPGHGILPVATYDCSKRFAFSPDEGPRRGPDDDGQDPRPARWIRRRIDRQFRATEFSSRLKRLSEFQLQNSEVRSPN